MRTLTENAGKRFWMSEYGTGDFPVDDIRTGLQLSTQVENQHMHPTAKCTDVVQMQHLPAAASALA